MRRLRFLVSYYYYRDIDLGKWLAQLGGSERIGLFADSGAYSAKTMGQTISVDEYATWVKQWAHLFDVYASLDVIGDPKASKRNQTKLERKGLAPMPVFHTGEPWAVLDGYLERYGYIALGGMVGVRNLGPWLVECFRRAGDKAVYHGFGMTTWGLIRDFPFYSLDSSSWGSGHRYGTIQLFDRGRWVRTQVGSREVYRHARLIREHGGDPAVFGDRAKYHRSHMARLSAVAWLRAEEWLRQRHGGITVPGRPDGPNVYLADTGRPNIEDVAGMKVYHAATTGHHQTPPAEMKSAAEEQGPHVYLADTDKGNLRSAAGPLIYLVGDHATSASADTKQAAAAFDGPHVYLASSHKDSINDAVGDE